LVLSNEHVSTNKSVRQWENSKSNYAVENLLRDVRGISFVDRCERCDFLRRTNCILIGNAAKFIIRGLWRVLSARDTVKPVISVFRNNTQRTFPKCCRVWETLIYARYSLHNRTRVHWTIVKERIAMLLWTCSTKRTDVLRTYQQQRFCPVGPNRDPDSPTPVGYGDAYGQRTTTGSADSSHSFPWSRTPVCMQTKTQRFHVEPFFSGRRATMTKRHRRDRPRAIRSARGRYNARERHRPGNFQLAIDNWRGPVAW